MVNFANAPTQARVRIPWNVLTGATWRLDDDLADRSYDRDGREMQDSGRYVDLAPWQSHLFRVEPHHA